jgi:hypothetical protein
MGKKTLIQLCALLTINLLAACQAESIHLTAPTARPSRVAPTIEMTTTSTPRAKPSTTPTPVTSPTAAPQPLAELIDLQGTGRWRASDTTNWDDASTGQALWLKNQVLTEVDTKAIITYLDGVRIYVAPKTFFTVTDLQQNEDLSLTAALQLLIGQLFLSHNGAQDPHIHIETEAGIAGVRGTMMSVKVTLSGRVIITCLEGTCTLENNYGLVVLKAGQQAEILNNTTPPIYLDEIADYQLNEWFANHTEALSVTLNNDLIAQLPDDCDLDDSLSCHIELDCDPETGVGCQLPEGCDAMKGMGCELPAGCNPITGEGCALPSDCDLLTGKGCLLESGCNPVTWKGCAQPLNCNLLTGRGCQPGAECDLQNGQGCEISSGCNLFTGKDCVCEIGNDCLGVLYPTPTNTPAPIPTARPTESGSDGGGGGDPASGSASGSGGDSGSGEGETTGDGGAGPPVIVIPGGITIP